MLQLEYLQLSHIWPPFRNIIGIHEELPKSTHLHWIQVSACPYPLVFLIRPNHGPKREQISGSSALTYTKPG